MGSYLMKKIERTGGKPTFKILQTRQKLSVILPSITDIQMK
jgi:hypothetical protein